MGLEKVREWYRRMERIGEADIPFLEIDGTFYTPRDILRHAEANDIIWKRILEVRPDLDPSPEEISLELLKERIRRKYEQGKLLPIRMLGYPYELTPEQQLAEVEMESPLGMKILEAEKKLLRELQP